MKCRTETDEARLERKRKETDRWFRDYQLSSPEKRKQMLAEVENRMNNSINEIAKLQNRDPEELRNAVWGRLKAIASDQMKVS